MLGLRVLAGVPDPFGWLVRLVQGHDPIISELPD